MCYVLVYKDLCIFLYITLHLVRKNIFYVVNE